MSALDIILASPVDPAARPFFAAIHERLRRAGQKEGPRSTLIDECIETIVAGESLGESQAEAVFEDILGGDLADEQVGALLVALRPESLPAETIAAFARVLQRHATLVQPRIPATEPLGDTCGTGSDTLGTYNISTTIAFVLAACNVRIAKHGNRAITSRCGSADVLGELGARVSLSSGSVESCIEKADVGIGFMYAPEFHRSLKNLQRIRTTLADQMPPEVRRTIFNVLGPLVNPARANTQIIGVYSPALVTRFAHVLRLRGIRRALIAYGTCDRMDIGLDEFSTAGKTVVAELRDGEIREWEYEPEEAGLVRLDDPNLLRGGSIKENASILRGVLSGSADQPKLDIALLNAGAGLFIADRVSSIRDGVAQARETIASGAAMKRLEAFVRYTQELGPSDS